MATQIESELEDLDDTNSFESRLLKYLPFAAGLLIFLGVLKLTLFYNYFDIQILSYISLSDALKLFLIDIDNIVLVVIIGSLHYLVTGEISERIDTFQMENFFLKYKKAFFIFFGLSSSLIIILLISKKLSINSWIIYLLVFTLSQTVSYLFLRKSINEDTGIVEASLKYYNIVLLYNIVLVIAVIPVSVIKDIQNVKDNSQTVRLYKREEIVLSSSNDEFYLGKSGDYHFFYSENEIKSTIIKDSDIDRIEIINN